MLLSLNNWRSCALYFFLLLLTVQCEAQRQAPPPTPTVGASQDHLLLGTWKSVTDPRFTVTITPTAYTEHYPDSSPTALKYSLATTCRCDEAAAVKATTKRLLVTYETNPTDCYCYSIDQLTSQHLVLLYIGRGNRLEFEKVK